MKRRSRIALRSWKTVLLCCLFVFLIYSLVFTRYFCRLGAVDNENFACLNFLPRPWKAVRSSALEKVINKDFALGSSVQTLQKLKMERPSALKSAGTEDFMFKIYVYELPLWANSLVYKRHPWCSHGVFSSEIYVHEQLLNNVHNVRTWDPELADFFYVPVYATCLVYRSFSQFPKYRFLVEEVLKYIINEMPYWKRSQGRDHIWPFVHDFGGCLSWLDNTDQVYFKELRNSIFLSHLGDLNMGCFNTHKDIVIPPLMTDSRLWKEGRGGRMDSFVNKTIFAHFRGTVNWYHNVGHYSLKIKAGYSPHYSNGVRQFLLKTYEHDPLMQIFEGPSKNYLEEVKNSVFCLCPRGFAPWSRRFFDSVALGCIPVIIADNIELPFEEFIDYRKFTVKVMESDIANLKDILLSIPKQRILEMANELTKAWIHFTYQKPMSVVGDAFALVLRKLARKVQIFKASGGANWG
jgi:putative beta-1,4-xylosyltransferase IRX10